MAVTIDDARAIAAELPRSYEAVVRGSVRFRVGRIVYAAFYRDDTIMGFAFAREEREALVGGEPEKFLLPRPSDMRYRWVCVRLGAIELDELRELIVDAWRMCVPKKVAAAYEGLRLPPTLRTGVDRPGQPLRRGLAGPVPGWARSQRARYRS